MAEYIDKQKLIGALEAKADMVVPDYKPAFLGVAKIVELLPTVDAVVVVRCRDCKHWNHGDCYRLELSRPDDFCAYGEKSGTQPQREDV